MAASSFERVGFPRPKRLQKPVQQRTPVRGEPIQKSVMEDSKMTLIIEGPPAN